MILVDSQQSEKLQENIKIKRKDGTNEKSHFPMPSEDQVII